MTPVHNHFFNNSKRNKTKDKLPNNHQNVYLTKKVQLTTQLGMSPKNDAQVQQNASGNIDKTST